MLGYTEIDKEIIEGLRQFKKLGENCKISGAIDLNGKSFREVIFTKKSFGKLKLEIKGYLFLDYENKIVTNKSILNDLMKLGYYYEIFFYDDKGTGILSALKTQGDIQRDKSSLEEVVNGLDFLLEQKVYAAERVKGVIIRMPNLRENNNSTLEELSNLIKEMRKLNLNFNEEMFNKLYPYYEEVLKANFETVKYIATLQDCCDEVIREAEKKRKKWAVRIKSKAVGLLIKVSDELSYYKRLILIYSSILNMNSSQYVKFLKNLNKERIEERINLIRTN